MKIDTLIYINNMLVAEKEARESALKYTMDLLDQRYAELEEQGITWRTPNEKLKKDGIEGNLLMLREVRTTQKQKLDEAESALEDFKNHDFK